MLARMPDLGRALVVLGLVLVALGLALSFGPSWLGRLPGDLRIERPGFAFYLPITTSILVSLLLSLLLWLFTRGR